MATDAVVMEPAGEWVAAFEVQQRFLQHSGPNIDSLDYSGRCRQMGEVGGDFYNFVTSLGIGWRWPLGMLPARASRRR
jgi:hypothetical protein